MASLVTAGALNGLNQLTSYAGKSLTHDAKGNVTGFGTDTFAYSSENLMTSATVGGTGTTLSYDPLMRLYQTVAGASTSRFLYDGLDGIAEYNSANALQRRWVFDPTTGQPVIWFEGTGTAATNRRYLSADERGSIISVSDSTGASLGINAYDEYGIPKSPLTGRYGYTGQAWIPSAQLWYYKARVYHPQLGRFLQPDPIGYAGSPNLYAYVLNDPINLVDPLGLLMACVTGPGQIGGIIVVGSSVTSCSNVGFGMGAGGSPGGVGLAFGVSQELLFTARPRDSEGQGEGEGNANSCAIGSTSTVEAARDVLEATALGADVATVGLTAGGITAPAALATKGIGLGAEGILVGINAYDAFARGNWSPLQIQKAGILGRIAPGGRTLQAGLIAARGHTGLLRDSLGRFRPSRLKNPAVKEAGDAVSQQYAEALGSAIVCGQ